MKFSELISDFEPYLYNLIKGKKIISEDLKASMLYSVSRGGKRLRPGLCLITAKAFGFNINDVYPYASSLEMIHEFSLVHDDLPCMDNDSIRRGKPTTHIVYGDTNALLAGDGLLNLAMEIALDDLFEKNCKYKLEAYKYLFNKSGSEGMIDGQSFELNSGKNLNDYMKTIKKKTVALFECAIFGSGLYLGVSDDRLDILKKFSKYLGIGFQVIDDRSDGDGIYKISEDSANIIIEDCYFNIKNIYNSLTALNVDVNGYKEITDKLFSTDFINK